MFIKENAPFWWKQFSLRKNFLEFKVIKLSNIFIEICCTKHTELICLVPMVLIIHLNSISSALRLNILFTTLTLVFL